LDSDHIWYVVEEKNMEMSVWRLVLVDAGVVTSELRVAESEEDLFLQLGREGLDIDHIVLFSRVCNLSEKQEALYRS
jgi:glyoxylase-like metal-dependent hydrolase (beta-lactamase superfamily II)